MRLVEVLAERGLVNPSQLGSLLGQGGLGDDQVVSYLGETGAISTDQLAQALSVVHGVPPALDADFARADPALCKRLRAHQASSLKAIPLYLTANRRVAVAMVDPMHPKAIDELGFVLGAVVEPMVTSEVAHTREMERLYALPPRRTTGFHPAPGSGSGNSPLREAATRSLNLTPPPNSLEPAIDMAANTRRQVATPPARTRLKAPTLSYQVAVSDLPMFVPADAGAPIAPMVEECARTPLPPMIAVTGSDSAVEQILAAPDRQAAADQLFAFMRACFGAGAMFAVNGVFAEGRFGYNLGNPCSAVESLVFSLSLPSCFHAAYTQSTVFHGSPPPDGSSIHKPLWNALGCQPPVEVLVVPVVAAGRIPILLYAQGRKGGRVERFAADRIERVAAALASTLVRLAG
jgi:hypothetical protein